MPTGRYKVRGRYNLVLVDFGNASHEIDEFAYRNMGYLPRYESLPWDEPIGTEILIIDVMPKRPLSLCLS